MAKKQILNPDELRNLLDYDPETGVLTWKPRPASMFPDERAASRWNARFAGRPAFATVNGNGYLVGGIAGRMHKAHRVCWAILHGEWPTVEIDHENGDRTDNRNANLRAVTPVENHHNKKRPENNTSGVIGVCWHKPSGKWLARIMASGKEKCLGYFRDIAEAAAARKAAEIELGFHANHGRSA